MDISSIKNISDCFKIKFFELEQCIDQDEINFFNKFCKNKYKENNNNYFFLAGDKFDQSFNDNKLIIKKLKI